MKLDIVDSSLLPSLMHGARGRRSTISASLFQEFENLNTVIAHLEFEESDGKQTLQDVKRLYAATRSYAKNRDIPVHVNRIESDIYFIKVHQTSEGKPLYNYPITADPPEEAATTQIS